MDTSITVWSVTITGLIILFTLDFFIISKKPHEVKFKEALLLSIFYILIAVMFGIVLYFWQGADYSTQYFTAYIVEKSLSVDNIFVFIIILTQFATPPNLHQRVLLVGIIIALIMRGIFIAVGAALLAYFAFTFVIFGGFLIWTGIQLARHKDEDPDPSSNILIRFLLKKIPYSNTYDGTRLTTRINNKIAATPLLIVMVAIGLTDLLFALDSIPATFGVTQEAYLVFAANAFALMGLRALYFLVKGLLDRLVYLSLGLSVILIFIGVKLILAYLHGLNSSIPHIPTQVSLLVIAIILILVGVFSWIKVRKDPSAYAHAGRIMGMEVENQPNEEN